MAEQSLQRQVSRKRPFTWHAVALLAAVLLAGCASTEITTDDVSWKAEPKPDQLIVFDFATSPDEVKLDHGLIADVRELVDREPRTAQEKKIGHSVANALADALVADLHKAGLPAVRAVHVVEPGVRPLQVKGQILSVDEGNRTRRVIIGLGVGRSTVETRVQLYESIRGRAQLLEQMTATTKSGRKPGMAEMIGVGALTGHIITSTVLSGAASGASEALSANVDALSKTMAKKLSAKIVEYYKERGWL
jgi:outer membrane murein-binding lipoprotein Lpp